MKVNFVDLKSQYKEIKSDIDRAVQDVFSNTAFSGGPSVKKFEENFAKLHNARFCVAVNSGTAALHASLMATGAGPGDEIIVPANTFFATPEAVSLTGAIPVFIDCEEKYYNIDPEKIKVAITEKTKAIIAVHLYGQPAKIDIIKKIADENNLYLIEDCAQAVLCEYKNEPVGKTGITGCFSFYPSKNLGAFGEGGAVITDDDGLKDRLEALRDHGSSKKYYHDFIGHNYRMDGIQGAVLQAKLSHIKNWTEKRRENAKLYKKYLSGIEEIKLPAEMENSRHVYHLYVIRADERDRLQKHLTEHEIGTGIHYPIPCHRQRAYNFLNYEKNSLPVCEKFAGEILSLPMSEQLTENEIKYVSEKIKEFYS